MHGKDQSHQTQEVITVQMTDEDVTDAMEINLVAHHLHLATFTAIDEEETVLDFHQLAWRESAIGWYGAAWTQYSDLERQVLLFKCETPVSQISN